jgi:hypothetical protein
MPGNERAHASIFFQNFDFMGYRYESEGPLTCLKTETVPFSSGLLEFVSVIQLAGECYMSLTCEIVITTTAFWWCGLELHMLNGNRLLPSLASGTLQTRTEMSICWSSCKIYRSHTYQCKI